MGTDITFFAEERLSDGQWSVVDELVPSHIYFPDDPECENDPPMVPYSIDIPRSSGLFAVLAGIVSGARFEVAFRPIAEPRGLPSDASVISREWYCAWQGDAVSSSWLSFAEIDCFEWNKVVPNSVYDSGTKTVTLATYAEIAGYSWFRELIEPYRRCKEARFLFWFDQ